MATFRTHRALSCRAPLPGGRAGPTSLLLFASGLFGPFSNHGIEAVGARIGTAVHFPNVLAICASRAQATDREEQQV